MCIPIDSTNTPLIIATVVKRRTRGCAKGNKRDQGAAHNKAQKKKKQYNNTRRVHTERLMQKRKQEKRPEDERENNQDECGVCADNLDVVLKTNTVGPQSFAVAAANPVYRPCAYLDGSLETNQDAFGTRLA